ncbi:MAG TPA: DUF1573 domain-containing protein [Blastocatellia bacterium]|nr:DUF1573 domain-containing protein [Blastocatellia bacterium]HMX27300.1 DUF1573 domain-containing protein [Blastocatellia bacterium]HMZ17021.1 DUF1573 domain-containing protein [Blastocatellia bacterium]HNG33023.1 DUF1573 domain-containing protein [Blastocatellia bacterium]
MTLKKITLAALLISALALTVFGQDQSKTENAEGKGAPKLVIDNTKFEFGKVKEGEEISHVFKIKNEGTAELVIVNVSPACGCTAGDFTKTLAPGAEGIIKLSVKTAGMNGWTERYADVISNDKTQPNLKLWVKMDVQKADVQATKN